MFQGASPLPPVSATATGSGSRDRGTGVTRHPGSHRAQPAGRRPVMPVDPPGVQYISFLSFLSFLADDIVGASRVCPSGACIGGLLGERDHFAAPISVTTVRTLCPARICAS